MVLILGKCPKNVDNSYNYYYQRYLDIFPNTLVPQYQTLDTNTLSIKH